MQGLRDKFLAATGRPSNQDCSEMWSNTTNTRKELPHRSAVADDALELGAVTEFVLKFECPLPPLYLLDHGAEAFAERRNRNGFVQVIAGPFADCLHSRLS